MVPDRDIYRAAHLLMHRHGADAMIAAARLMDLPLDRPGREARLEDLLARLGTKLASSGASSPAVVLLRYGFSGPLLGVAGASGSRSKLPWR